MRVISGEKILLESDNGEAILTSHRVRFEAKKWGRAHLISIMLEELCSCEIRYASKPVLLILAALSVIGGIASKSYEGLILGIIISLILAVTFFLSRRQIISLASGSATIKLRTTRMGLEAAKQFIDQVEEAKSQRYALRTHQ